MGVSRGYLGKIERAEANPSLATLEQLATALGMGVELRVTFPLFLSERRPHDVLHARCVEAIARHLDRAGWKVAREVEVSDDRVHAWIDLLASDARAQTLLIVEVKTRLDDLGGLQRQIGWYERRAMHAARIFGWTPLRTGVWLVGLASREVDDAISASRSFFDERFPGRAGHMLDVTRGTSVPVARSLALVDPPSRRAEWLIRTRLDGRRARLRYTTYADAATRLGR